MTDFNLANHGSVLILTPITQAGKEWVGEHIPEDAQRWAMGVVIEPRYVEGIVVGIRGDGLSIE